MKLIIEVKEADPYNAHPDAAGFYLWNGWYHYVENNCVVSFGDQHRQLAGAELLDATPGEILPIPPASTHKVGPVTKINGVGGEDLIRLMKMAACISDPKKVMDL